MENHHFSWENPLFQWPFSIAMLVITRGYPYIHGWIIIFPLRHTHMTRSLNTWISVAWKWHCNWGGHQIDQFPYNVIILGCHVYHPQVIHQFDALFKPSPVMVAVKKCHRVYHIHHQDSLLELVLVLAVNHQISSVLSHEIPLFFWYNH